MNPLVISVLVAVAVVGMVLTLGVLFLRRQDEGKAADRLDQLVGRGKRTDSSADMLLKQALLEVDRKNLLDKLTPEFLNLTKAIEQADANVKPSALLGVGLMAGFVGGLTTAWLVNLYVAPVVALILLTAPFGWLWWKRNSRLKAFAGQLPEGMELVARALRAGHSLAAGLHVVAEEMPAPIADEFSRVFEESNLGIPIEEAMKSMCERVPNLDLRFFVTSVSIQRQTGGDLAEILDKIGYVVRERFRILGQVKALTGEGRLSGVVLIALPFALFGFMLNLKPDYVESLWTTDLGKKMSVFAIIAQILGALTIRKIVNIKV